MPFDFNAFDIGESATAFNAAELTGLDSFSAAAEAGITDANAFDFAQGPDGFLGSAIPGAGGDLGPEGWYNVDYDQPFYGSDTQSALFDGGSVDGFAPDYDTRFELSNIDAGASVDGNIDPTAGGLRIEDVGPSNFEPEFNPYESAAETARLERFAETGFPVSQPGLVDQITGRSALFADQIKTSAAGAIDSATAALKAQIPDLQKQLISKAGEVKNQLIGQAIGAATGAVKSYVAGALPAPLAKVANNLVDKASNNAASVFGATPVSAAAGGGGGGGDGATGATFAGGGGPGTETAAAVDSAAAGQSATPTVSLAAVGSAAAVAASDAGQAAAAALSNAAANAVGSAAAVLSNTATGLGANAAAAAAAAFAPNQILDPQQAAAANEAAAAYSGKLLAQRGEVLAAQTKQASNGDWRLRLSLAPGADYLYNATPNGILAPLKNTGGVIFPYTPKITTSYNAKYSPTDLTHSNYMNYFYQNSNVGEIGIDAKFTAQDTNEAAYLLAVIHFFRSVTRMFYGQDAQRGAPPPLVFLTGFGEFQFNRHPCVVSSFAYTMPDGVDYIRARSVNVNGTNLLSRRDRQTAPTDPISGAVQRISNLFSSQGISPGAVVTRPSPPTLGQNNPTYVPTSVDLSLRLLPMQSRTQVSQQFSLKGFANGDLIRGGFW